MENFILLIIFCGLSSLFLIDIGVIFYCFLLRKKLGLFSQGTQGNLEELIAEQKNKLNKQGTEIAKMLQEIARLKDASQKSFQKIGVVRFNPFGELGGNQSFSIALLDAENNGFVITGLYGREGNRVYAKPIEQGSSKYPLSGEEKKAIGEAMR